MAHANKRITVTLIIVAFLFILTIILLIIPYKGPSYTYDSSSSDEQTGGKVSHSSTSTTSTLSSTMISILKSTPTSPPTSTSTKRIEITPESSGTSSTTISSYNGTTLSSTDLQNINDTTSGLTQEYYTTYSTDSTGYDSNTTSYEITSYGEENDTSEVSETTDTSRGSETDDTDTSNITTYTSAYNESSSTSSTSDDKNETSTILSTDILVDETTDVSTTYSTEYGLSDSYTTINVTTTMETSELPVNTTTAIYENFTSVSTEETTTGYSVNSTSISTTTTSADSTSESTDETTTISEVFDTNTCTSDECKQLAARMLDLMDHSMDPCQDFYQYSCGNGVDNPYLSPVNPKDAAMNRIKEAILSSAPGNSARVLYESCLDKTTPSQENIVAYIHTLAMEFGEIDPRSDMKDDNKAFYNYIDENPFNFTAVFAKMMKHHFTPFFDMALDVDDRNTSQFILRLTPPLYHSPLTENVIQYTCLNEYYQQLTTKPKKGLDELYENYGECTRTGSGIADFGENTLKSVQKLNLTNHISDLYFRTKTDKSIAFEVEDGYAKLVMEEYPNPGDVRLSLMKREYTLYTLQEMDDGGGRDLEGNEKPLLNSTFFSWHGLVEELLERNVDPTITYVQVYFPDELAKVIDDQNYEFAEEHHKFRNILLALWSQYLYSNLLEPLGHSPHSEEYCLSVVTELLPDITTQLYLRSFDQNSLKNQIKKVEEINNQVKDNFMSQFTDESNNLTEMIKQKLELMKLDKGEKLLEDYQDFIGKLPDFQEELNKEDFPRNVIQLLNRYRRILYSFYEENPNNSFIMWLQSNLPYYTSGSTSYPLNTVLVPIGSVESPIFEQKGPDFINFAGLGQMISHEMMHAFDSTGVRFELENAQNMVNPSEQCQKKQLNKAQTFIINDVSMNAALPVDLVLNEALSDSSSVRMAWEAYRIKKDVESVYRKRRATKGRRPKSSKLTETSEVLKHDQAHSFEILPWLDTNPLKQFYIRSAQIHCEKSSKVNLLHLKENEHLHGSLRVNHMARNDPLFHQAFSCPNDSPMNKDPQCSYIPLSDS